MRPGGGARDELMGSWSNKQKIGALPGLVPVYAAGGIVLLILVVQLCYAHHKLANN
ncbi:hypothetical protein FC50_GL001173 [Lacticaseibacillus pantheris DSM 15945 = JCM 12539 = NBRC 106106]|uniref:Uncharacterized protein n=1 Tax=Lacticaseibacillus pantheris DSM 15945 = JCM 12539 = NBRC 106106 TaxID=1423783 RepID=A0A0R1TX64_9LACO|nr:hypothetical protein FC50_GL001173 [Lacticaseibacillus pantheris DSM 15945 = JCM 12539 = NBRC 106106]